MTLMVIGSSIVVVSLSGPIVGHRVSPLTPAELADLANAVITVRVFGEWRLVNAFPGISLLNPVPFSSFRRKLPKCLLPVIPTITHP